MKPFPHFNTMLSEIRSSSLSSSDVNGGGVIERKVISVLMGDFLAPYLLLSVNRGFRIMRAIAQTPIDDLIRVNQDTDVTCI